MTIENTESRPLVKGRRVKDDYSRPFAECAVKGCGKKFYGPRRNAKLGGHNYQIHVRPNLKVKKVIRKVAPVVRRIINLAPLDSELGKVSKVLAALKELKPASRVIVKFFIETI